MSLMGFITFENKVRVAIGKKPIDIDCITPDEAQELFRKIDNSLDRELLSNNGERKVKDIIALRRFYRYALDDLMAMGFVPVRDLIND